MSKLKESYLVGVMNIIINSKQKTASNIEYTNTLMDLINEI